MMNDTPAVVSIGLDGPDGGQTAHLWNITRAQYDELKAVLTRILGEPDVETSTDNAGLKAAADLFDRIAVVS